MLTTYQKLNEYTTQTGLGENREGYRKFQTILSFSQKKTGTQRYAMLLYGKILRAF